MSFSHSRGPRNEYSMSHTSHNAVHTDRCCHMHTSRSQQLLFITREKSISWSSLSSHSALRLTRDAYRAVCDGRWNASERSVTICLLALNNLMLLTNMLCRGPAECINVKHYIVPQCCILLSAKPPLTTVAKASCQSTHTWAAV